MSKVFYENRDEIKEEYTWDLKAMYKDLDSWSKDIEQASRISEKICEYRGKIGESSANLLDTLNLLQDLYRKLSMLNSYASMSLDQDTRDTEAQELKDKAFQAYVSASEKTSFVTPEILTIDEDVIDGYLEENNDLKIYKQDLKNCFRGKDHVLSPKEESILAQMGEVLETSQQTFSMLNNADLKFPTIKDESGEEVELTHGNFIPFLRSKDRRVRKDAYEALYTTYGGFKNTFAKTLTGEVKKNIINSRLRKYNSSMEASLAVNNIDTKVYDNLLNSVHDNLDTMHKYIGIRKRALGLDKLKMYDIYTPIVDDISMEIGYEEGKKLMLEGLQPLGTEYIKTVEEGIKNRWIDVYENKGKRSGAYSGGAYDSMPYILLNYQNQLDDVFTLVHEMGHSMHSYLTRENQPPVYGGYGIFVAEVASTTNEALLLDHMLNNATSDKEKLYLLNHYLEQFRGTIFRQTMFAEFEKMIYEYVEEGGVLTAEYLSTIYKDLNVKYYGEEIEMDDFIAMEWARIPHFYYNYYVFQYATGYSAAIAFSDMILKNGEPAVEKYLNFLKSGRSDYPLNVLKKAGVDMLTRNPIDNAMDTFRKLVDEIDKLIK